MKLKSIKEQIKEHFLINPTDKLRVRQIEKKLKIPLPSAIRYVKELVKEEILSINKLGNIIFYTGDRSSKNFIIEKKLYNIKSLFQIKLIDFLIGEYSNPIIILFGSYSKGEDIETSDIDLYIQTLSNKKLNLEKYENLLKRKIHLFIHKNIKDIKNPHLANNIINGITLNGFLEIFK